MKTNNPQISQLQSIIGSLQQTLNRTNLKNGIQLEIFHEFVRIFNKFSQKLAHLSNRINQQILSAQDEQQESIANVYQHLSNSLLRMADCSKNVAIKAKNEVHDPMKLFVENYQTLNSELITKLKQKQVELNDKYLELSKNKEIYLSASEKLEKNRRIQGKSMAKIENGDLQQLQKYKYNKIRFNSNIKKLTENIKQSEQQYTGTVDKINKIYKSLRKQLKDIVKSLSYNEQSRISFAKKSLVSSIRTLEDFKTSYDSTVERKIEDSLKKNEEDKDDSVLQKNLNTRIALLAASKYKQQFISYQELIKQKRKKSLQQQNNYLAQTFAKVREQDKQMINSLTKPWFETKSIIKKASSLESPTKTGSPTKIEAPTQEYLKQLDTCKQKILSVQPYSYYFIQTVYQQVLDMSSFYCKLADEDFLLLLNMFITITSNLDIQENTPASLLAVEFVYKMVQVSMRIMWRKNSKSSKGQPIQLLCQHYGMKCKSLSNQINLKKIYMYIHKKKLQKKTVQQTQSQSKGMMSSFVKGFQAAIKSKKQQMLTDDQIFNCLTEMTQMMANLLIASQIAIPFIKSLLGKGQNSRSFQYLKSILLEKKDIQERQRIFYQTQIKGKKEEQMKKIIQSKRLGVFCIQLAAQKGFFSREELNLRLVCKELTNIHRQILCHLNIRSEEWIHLIPLNPKLDYVALKQQVAENSVPSAVEEIITLDVNRSLHNHGQILNPTVLHSLLRIYAYFHKDISYCQGMNYIAGYLYIKTKDQESAYRIFEHLMEVRFKELFANEFEVLKVKMYQFERLLGIFHPEISDHFKKQAISPQCYIVSWIITLFASSYQYTMSSHLIDVLWERFIIWGWAQFFKFVLSLFNMFKDELVELTYDKALHFLGQMGRSEMFLTSKKDFKLKFPENKVEEGMQQYPITEQLLQSLKKQYKLN